MRKWQQHAAIWIRHEGALWHLYDESLRFGVRCSTLDICVEQMTRCIPLLIQIRSHRKLLAVNSVSATLG